VESEIEVIRFLSEKERDLLNKTNIVLVVPFIVVNRLTGALFVSKKSTGQGYNKFEIETLLKLSSQVALALEHSLLYQFQEDRIKKILHTDKLATIGEIAAGIAHEIRNPLTSIRSTVQYLKNDIPSEKQKLIRGVIEEVDRIDQIIKGLLSFSRTSELKMDKVNIIEILDQTLLLLESEMQKNKIQIEKNCKVSNTIIMGDASQLKQVFLNVLLNSFQAISADGKIQINLNDETDQDSIHRKNDLLCIKIKDNGKGIHENELNKVFDPFYTTKETGTGLGLSISYGIIKKHGGEIEIDSKTEPPDNGTTVTIWLSKE
jgi:signal transduction histidine kinase